MSELKTLRAEVVRLEAAIQVLRREKADMKERWNAEVFALVQQLEEAGQADTVVVTSHRLVHDLGCDYESEIVGTEQPCVVVNAETHESREAYCGCGANPALAKDTEHSVKETTT